MDFMIRVLHSVRVSQYAKKNRSELFVCLFVRSVAFPAAVNHGKHGSQLSRSDSAPRSQTNHHCAMVQTVINPHNIN